MLEMNLEASPVKRRDYSQEPEIPRKTVVATVPSGEIRTEKGADGTWLLFDCDCLDALPICKAHCCSLKGIIITPEEYASGIYDEAIWNQRDKVVELHHDSDGACAYLCRRTCKCEIYEDRPSTCQDFHCTRGEGMRGWKMSNGVFRLSTI